MTTDKEQELLDEIKMLATRADIYLDDAGGYVQASYHVVCDLIYREKNPTRLRHLNNIKRAIMDFGADLHKKREKFQSILNEVSGPSGVDDESES